MFHVPEDKRINFGPLSSEKSDGNNGAFILNIGDKHILTVASDGKGWEHVSVSDMGSQETPTWKIMCQVKDTFWDRDDCVVQFHPPASVYVNFHPGCLHMWRKTGYKFPVPPSWMVGPKT